MLGLSRLSPHFPGLFMRDWAHGDSRPVDHVMGAFTLMRRSLFDSLLGFDERFFMYLEDLDFSLRAGRAGWRSFYLAEARVYHKSGGTSEQIKGRRAVLSPAEPPSVCAQTHGCGPDLVHLRDNLQCGVFLEDRRGRDERFLEPGQGDDPGIRAAVQGCGERGYGKVSGVRVCRVRNGRHKISLGRSIRHPV